MQNTPKTIKDLEKEPVRSIKNYLYGFGHDVIKNFEALSVKPVDSMELVKQYIPHFEKLFAEQERISRESEKSRIIEQVKNSRDIIPEIYYLRMVEIIKTNKE